MHSSTNIEFPVDWRFFLKWALQFVMQPLTGRLFHRKVERLAKQVAELQSEVDQMSQAEIVEALGSLHGELHLDELFSPQMVRALALSARLAELTVGLRPFPSQIEGAIVLLAGGLAEMETGAGKTLTAALAASVAVYAGTKVHLITVNDYLAQRDATDFLPLYEAAGINVGVIIKEVPPESRADIYAKDVVYATNKEIAFDYLRNRIVMGAQTGPIGLSLETLISPKSRAQHLTMKGLPFAIVDEADSVLIDECRTPLIISADAQPDPQWAKTALELGGALEENRDFQIETKERKVSLTPVGRETLKVLGDELGGIWRNDLRREGAARQAIAAQQLYVRDEHYVVREGKVELVDEYTGRIAKDRALGDGLHQLIQSKEGVPVTGRRYTKGRLTYQRFFRRYERLAGMTGTAREVAGELATIYGLRVVTVKPHHASRRVYKQPQLLFDETTKWSAVRAETIKIAALGRPVLIATRTIKASQDLSAAFSKVGLDHVVLSATQNSEEGEVISRAGESSRVTIATNMAGRGVDIKLDEKVADLGGLHVILTERHEAGRIDRQVQGRCARQGDEGSSISILSWQDPLVEIFGSLLQKKQKGGVATFGFAQWRAERLHARARLDLLKQDQRRDGNLTFTGSVE